MDLLLWRMDTKCSMLVTNSCKEVGLVNGIETDLATLCCGAGMVSLER